MKRQLLARVLGGAFALACPLAAAQATFETAADRATAASAAELARTDLQATFDRDALENGEHVWKQGAGEVTRVVISLSDQLAYAYDADELVGVSTISSGNEEKPTPTGIFTCLRMRGRASSTADVSR